MPRDPIDTICETFTALTDLSDSAFWKPDILSSVVGVIFYRLERLLDCYPDRPDIMAALLTRIREIYDRYSDMKSSYQARDKLWDDMKRSNVLLAIDDVSWFTKVCVGHVMSVETVLNLNFIDLKQQKAALKKLAGICLSYFEERISEQLAEKQVAESSAFSPEHFAC